jgi:hypothetical protein
MVEAERHYATALELIDQLPYSVDRDRGELGLQIAMGTVLWTSKSWSHPDAGHAFGRAQELADKLRETS